MRFHHTVGYLKPLLLSDHEKYPFVELKTSIEDCFWTSGTYLEEQIPDLTFKVEGTKMDWCDYIQPNANIPLFSDHLRAVFDDNGIKNIEYVKAEIILSKTGEVQQYHAANILGEVSAVDRDRSEYEAFNDNEPLFVTDFQKLYLDQKMCGDWHLFRLAEYSQLIIISDLVKDAIQAANLNGVWVIKPEDWDGFISS